MHTTPTDTPSDDFIQCWHAAGLFLESVSEKAVERLSPELLMLPSGYESGVCVWLKADLWPPFLEHISFRLGNQLFFVRLEDMENKVKVPGTRYGLQNLANACKGHACLMPMLKRGDQWLPASSGWGLVSIPQTNIQPPHPDAYGLPVDPPALVTSEKIEMTDWELQDFAVQVVRNSLPDDKVIAWDPSPDTAPSLWFMGDDGLEWVIIKAVRYPIKDAEPPYNLDTIADHCSSLSRKGNFAVVCVAATEDPAKLQGEPLPLYRGHEMFFSYQGMKKLAV